MDDCNVFVFNKWFMLILLNMAFQSLYCIFVISQIKALAVLTANIPENKACSTHTAWAVIGALGLMLCFSLWSQWVELTSGRPCCRLIRADFRLINLSCVWRLQMCHMLITFIYNGLKETSDGDVCINYRQSTDFNVWAGCRYVCICHPNFSSFPDIYSLLSFPVPGMSPFRRKGRFYSACICKMIFHLECLMWRWFSLHHHSFNVSLECNSMKLFRFFKWNTLVLLLSSHLNDGQVSQLLH